MEEIDDLLIFFIDSLASNYHWEKSKILDELNFDEAMEYSKLIKKRQINNYITQLAIASNPHVKNPKELLKTFEDELSKLDNRGIMKEERDADAIKKLKQIFNKSKKK